MTIRSIVYLPHPCLRTPTEPVVTFDDALQTLIDDMFETMYAANGVGLAAPQIGVSKKLGVIDTRGDTPQLLCLINPEIVERAGEQLMDEGCLSLPGIWCKVPRATHVKMRALDRYGNPYEIEADGLLAHC